LSRAQSGRRDERVYAGRMMPDHPTVLLLCGFRCPVARLPLGYPQLRTLGGWAPLLGKLELARTAWGASKSEMAMNETEVTRRQLDQRCEVEAHREACECETFGSQQRAPFDKLTERWVRRPVVRQRDVLAQAGQRVLRRCPRHPVGYRSALHPGLRVEGQKRSVTEIEANASGRTCPLQRGAHAGTPLRHGGRPLAVSRDARSCPPSRRQRDEPCGLLWKSWRHQS